MRREEGCPSQHRAAQLSSNSGVSVKKHCHLSIIPGDMVGMHVCLDSCDLTAACHHHTYQINYICVNNRVIFAGNTAILILKS